MRPRPSQRRIRSPDLFLKWDQGFCLLYPCPCTPLPYKRVFSDPFCSSTKMLHSHRLHHIQGEELVSLLCRRRIFAQWSSRRGHRSGALICSCMTYVCSRNFCARKALPGAQNVLEYRRVAATLERTGDSAFAGPRSPAPHGRGAPLVAGGRLSRAARAVWCVGGIIRMTAGDVNHSLFPLPACVSPLAGLALGMVHAHRFSFSSLLSIVHHLCV